MQNPGHPSCPFSYYYTHTNIGWVGVEGMGADCHPLTQPTYSTLKKITHYSAMPLLVRTAIFFSLCNLKADSEKREIGTSNIEVNCG